MNVGIEYQVTVIFNLVIVAIEHFPLNSTIMKLHTRLIKLASLLLEKWGKRGHAAKTIKRFCTKHWKPIAI